MTDPLNIVALDAFLEAFRDAGYRGLPGALSELVDNSLEANASRVEIAITPDGETVDSVSVLDDGTGIAPGDLAIALQFGGSTRFDSRAGFGRYGIGLPGSSISQARRVDVFTWTEPEQVWWSYLALDDLRANRPRALPRPTLAAPPVTIPSWAAAHGTLVRWSHCDRITPLGRDARTSLHRTLGRTFRGALWSGSAIRVDDDPVLPVDPLFLRPGIAPAEAKPYGPPLRFDIDLPGRGRRRRATVTARFSELPIETWLELPLAEKRRRGVTKGAGVSILRANREIDSGWFFMGDKRRESYDDWWRCEVGFAPELDEFFGVTHTKQGIHPRAELDAILTPQLARIAHTLNGRVRRRFQAARATTRAATRGTKRAEQRDHLLEPTRPTHRTTSTPRAVPGLRYEVVHKELDEALFFRPEQRQNVLRLTLNRAHPFHAALRGELRGTTPSDLLELLLLAAARAERRLASHRDRAAVARHREHWSNTLAAFLG